MELISSLVKKDLPNYLSNLPVPDSVGGWFKLSCEWVATRVWNGQLELDLRAPYIIFECIGSNDVAKAIGPEYYAGDRLCDVIPKRYKLYLMQFQMQPTILSPAPTEIMQHFYVELAHLFMLCLCVWDHRIVNWKAFLTFI